MADSDSSVSPEKRLLDLIEGTGPAGPSEETVKEEGPSIRLAPKPKSVSKGAGSGIGLPSMDFKFSFSPDALIEFFSSVSKTVTGMFQGEMPEMNMAKLTQFARLAALLIGIVLVLNLLLEWYQTEQPVWREPTLEQKKMAEEELELKSIFSHGTNLVEKKNVFVPFANRGDKKNVTETGASVKLVEMTQQLKLTGLSIYPGDSKRTFCMIEDLQKNMTSFLREGDSVMGLKIMKITADGVTLGFQGEEIVLK